MCNVRLLCSYRAIALLEIVKKTHRCDRVANAKWASSLVPFAKIHHSLVSPRIFRANRRSRSKRQKEPHRIFNVYIISKHWSKDEANAAAPPPQPTIDKIMLNETKTATIEQSKNKNCETRQTIVAQLIITAARSSALFSQPLKCRSQPVVRICAWNESRARAFVCVCVRALGRFMCEWEYMCMCAHNSSLAVRLCA